MKHLCWLLLLTATAHARLGETKEQIQVRYGKPIQQTDADADYAKNIWRVTVIFIDGKSVSEKFTKAEGADLSHNEVDILLQRNSNNDWVQLSGDKGRRRWQRGNGLQLAEFTGKALRIWTKKQDDIETARSDERDRKKAEEERKTLDGF